MKITSSKQIYDCGLFRVTEDRAVDKKTGFEIKRCVVRHAGSAVMMAVDARTGAPLWSFQANQAWHASPMTYVFDGRQYLAVVAGSDVLALALVDAR